MTWTKAKIAVMAGAALLLLAGVSLLVIKEFHVKRVVHLAPGVLPRNPAELDAWYVEPPAAQNAATYVLQGIKALQIEGADKNANLPVLGQLATPAPGTPLSPDVKSALAVFMQGNRKALQFFAQGAEFQQARYPVDLSEGFDARLPHLQGVKRGVQMTAMAALLDADNGDGQQAADDVQTGLRLSHSLKDEPVTISQLVRVAGIAIAVDALNQVVNRATLPPESLSALSKTLQDMEDCDVRGTGFQRSIIGEKASDLSAVEGLSQSKNRNKLIKDLNQYGSSWGLGPQQKRRLLEYLKKTTNFKDEHDYLESTYQEVLTAHQDAFPDRLSSVSDVIKQRVKEAKERGLLVTVWLCDGSDKPISREARGLANLRLAMAAVALEQFRAAHANQYPGNLSALTPDYLPSPLLDPFDGQPLRYRRQGSGYLLYSIGPDLKDDGGAPMTPKGGDMVFSVARRPTL